MIKTLIRIPPDDMTIFEKFVIGSTSILFFGAILWTPIVYAYIWKKWYQIPKQQKQRKTIYAALLFALTGFAVAGPHRSVRFGKYIKLRDWKLWNIWLKFIAFEVRQDLLQRKEDNNKKSTIIKSTFDPRYDNCIQAFVPHGLMPLSIGIAGVPGRAIEAFGIFRKVVATATKFLPLLRDVMLMTNCV